MDRLYEFRNGRITVDKDRINSDCSEIKIDEVVFTGIETSNCSLIVDDGINYGIGFFETIHVLNSPVFLKDHLDRLNNSLETFNINRRITENLIYEIMDRLDIRNEALKISVTEKNVIASKRPVAYKSEYYHRGADIMTSDIVKSSKSFLVNHKSLNYGDMILSLRDAKGQGFDDCMFLNEKGFVTESTIGNIFIIKDGVIHTSSVENGLLPGIVRKYIIDKYEVVEGDIQPQDIYEFQGGFLTNSLVGVVKIRSIDGKVLPEYDLVHKIACEYFEYITREYSGGAL